MDDFDGKLKHAFTMLVVGMTNCGKTCFTSELILKRYKIMDNAPSKVIYCYRMWNPAFETLQRHGVEFVKGLDNLLEIIDEIQNCILVLDDMATDAASSKEVATMFTAGMHHRNISVIMIVHNLFMQAKYMREIMLNASYLVLFRNVRDSGQVRLLESQTRIKGLFRAYQKATAEKYTPLLIDLLPYTPDAARLRSHIFNKYQYVYVQE